MVLSYCRCILNTTISTQSPYITEWWIDLAGILKYQKHDIAHYDANHRVDGLVHEQRQSSALAVMLRLSCTNPLMQTSSKGPWDCDCYHRGKEYITHHVCHKPFCLRQRTTIRNQEMISDRCKFASTYSKIVLLYRVWWIWHLFVI